MNNISKYYGKFAALKNLSFDLFEGELFCLLGHNGAGKTTAIGILTGMLNKNEGEVEVLGILHLINF